MLRSGMGRLLYGLGIMKRGVKLWNCPIYKKTSRLKKSASKSATEREVSVGSGIQPAHKALLSYPRGVYLGCVLFETSF